MQTTTNLNIESIARLCEVAYICGNTNSPLKEQYQDLDLEGMFEEIYQPIFDDWQNKIDIRGDEEEGYISAYAQRVLEEKYMD